MEGYIQLNREFTPVSNHGIEQGDDYFYSPLTMSDKIGWPELDKQYRTVILTDAGVGKTEEFIQTARSIEAQGDAAFFIRIEDLDNDFTDAFEVGDYRLFDEWKGSISEAWFFLDSVDEARLENPRAFERAVIRFAKAINGNEHRAHIYISSRPDAWRGQEDVNFLDNYLFLPTPKTEKEQEENSCLKTYQMNHLDSERIRMYCVARQTERVDELIADIQRSGLWSLAERPFDLDNIIAKWVCDGVLGSRIELLLFNIKQRLLNAHAEIKGKRETLPLDKAMKGAQLLAASATLSGQSGFMSPNNSSGFDGLNVNTLLSSWHPNDIQALLGSAIFNGFSYGRVRFRHREIKELLAAEWFEDQLKKDCNRREVESLFFTEQYDAEIIRPKLKPILPWLMLFDEGIRKKALYLCPELISQGGDPSQLPLDEREGILTNIVERIASEQERGAQDTKGIARISDSRLSACAHMLICKYYDNDDAIFFLGRLVWQGKMSDSISKLSGVALNPQRGKYARRVSVRAVMACGTFKQKEHLWDCLNSQDTSLIPELLSELIEEAELSTDSIQRFVTSLQKIEINNYRQDYYSLKVGIKNFIKRLAEAQQHSNLYHLVDSVSDMIALPPHTTNTRGARVSEKHSWLIGYTCMALLKLIEVRSPMATLGPSLSILLSATDLSYDEVDRDLDYLNDLRIKIPQWPELNDKLYMEKLSKERLRYQEKYNKTLTFDCFSFYGDSFSDFKVPDLPRLIAMLKSDISSTDKTIILDTTCRVCRSSDDELSLLHHVETQIAGDELLETLIAEYIAPPSEPEPHAFLQEQRDENERKNRERKLAKNKWVAGLRESPEKVSSEGISATELTYNQCWLIEELDDGGLSNNRTGYSDWQALIPTFGEEVARAYRISTMDKWRKYKPEINSERGERDNSTPFVLIFAMAGLEIEANETANFPHYLTDEDVKHALRYITWHLNGFPSWLSTLFKSHPFLVIEAVTNELAWEYHRPHKEGAFSYILHDIIYHTPWLFEPLVPYILAWATSKPILIQNQRHYWLQVLTLGNAKNDDLLKLARILMELSDENQDKAWWFALWVSTEPDIAIDEVSKWFETLDFDDASTCAQVFVVALVGGRRSGNRSIFNTKLLTTPHLCSLYTMMFKYIQVKDDINRSGGGVFTPELRDDAQDARSELFTLISTQEGVESYKAMMYLASKHPESGYRQWMKNSAYNRAETDGDLPAWSESQVKEFESTGFVTPKTFRQLYELGLAHLYEIKRWVEKGNDSPYITWQRAETENEVRNLIAGQLNQKRLGKYTIAQEPELANQQRMDIWLTHSNITSPVPIELKILDKNWSGPKLCERLENQLAGSYMLEDGTKCGIFLLVWQGCSLNKRWQINGNRVGVSELGEALKKYWSTIAVKYSGIEDIEIVVIDLAARG